MKKFILLGSMAFLSLSCGSDNDDNTTNSPDPAQQTAILPVKMSVDGEKMNINYDGAKITTMISTTNTGNKVVFSYNGDLISSIKFYEGNILQTAMEYTYNSNNLLSSAINKEYSATGVVEHSVTNTYTHINANQVNVKRQISGTYFSSTITTVYNYSNGNMVSASGSGPGTTNGVPETHTETATYTYTDKNYPFKNVKGFDKLVHTSDKSDGMSYLFSNIKNNISSYKETASWTSSAGTGNSISTYKYTTTFSSSGYPLYESRKSVDANGNPDSSQPEIHTYEYNH